MYIPTYDDMLAAHERIKPHIRRTPIRTSDYLNEVTGAQLFFKCENFQKTGAFKVRGAANKITQLGEAKIICAHSSGNHAQAVTYVGRKLGLTVKIVMPSDTPQVKKNAVKGYGAEVIESGPTMADQEK